MMKLPLAHKKLLVVIFSVGSDRLGLPLYVEEVLRATSSCSYLCLVGYNSGFPHCCRHWEIIREAKDNKWHDFHTFFFTGLLLSASYCNSCSNIIRHTNHCQDFWWGKYHLLVLLVTFSTGQVIWNWQRHNHSYLHRRKDFSKEWILDSINALLPNAQNFSGKTLKSDYLVVMKNRTCPHMRGEAREECDSAPYSKSHIPGKYRLFLLKSVSSEGTSTTNETCSSNCIAIITLQ